MPLTNKEKKEAYIARQLKLFRRKREPYLTDKEWVKIKAEIKKMRE